MAVSEQDLEILELWLDGELTDEQIEALRRRLAREPELAQMLDRLRADRQLRARLWQSLMPADSEVESLVLCVRSAIHRRLLWSQRLAVLRRVSAVAASIVLVFMAGWISHDRLQIRPRLQASSPSSDSQLASDNSSSGQIQFFTPPEGSSFVSFPTDPRTTIRPGRYVVQVVDPLGRPIAVQYLDEVVDPWKFTEELSRLQRRQPRSGQADNITPVADKP